MRNQLYINGSWSPPAGGGTIEVFNPYTEEVLHRVAAGGPEDVDRAVAAARAALPGWRACRARRAGSICRPLPMASRRARRSWRASPPSTTASRSPSPRSTCRT